MRRGLLRVELLTVPMLTIRGSQALREAKESMLEFGRMRT
jgi:hypothetical protein